MSNQLYTRIGIIWPVERKKSFSRSFTGMESYSTLAGSYILSLPFETMAELANSLQHFLMFHDWPKDERRGHLAYQHVRQPKEAGQYYGLQRNH